MRGRVLYVVMAVVFLVGVAAGTLWKPVGMAFAQDEQVGVAASAPGVSIEGSAASKTWEVVRITDSGMHCLMIVVEATAYPLFFECVDK